ncbi:hypothetical protein [Natronosalvus caseinilyticus]|uniref:hypothetical protein n=1 Tax=Natronosalvus caseinilyticus TaxID=2953747 RepID=UPI0028AEEF93|nr:hypothetical protein [Natronosalvus caseinilyticus]
MPNEWKVIERVVDQFDLNDTEHEEYVMVVTKVYSEAMATSAEFEEFNEEYYNFLNREVFSDERVISTLNSFGLTDDQLAEFRNGTVSCDNLVKDWNELRFRIDELIDFAMMLKLIKDYSAQSDNGMIESRYRLQKLIYLVNRQISKQEDYSATGELQGDLGMLDHTGYRYRFTKRSSGPFSSDVYEDKNRLFAWALIEEPVASEDGTGEVAERNRSYGIELTPAGEMMVDQFDDRIEQADSIMLSSWNYAQQTVIDEVAIMTHEEVVSHINEDDRIHQTPTGSELLVGPMKKFKASEIEFLGELQGEFAHA